MRCVRRSQRWSKLGARGSASGDLAKLRRSVILNHVARLDLWGAVDVWQTFKLHPQVVVRELLIPVRIHKRWPAILLHAIDLSLSPLELKIALPTFIHVR